ncbi:hypothetical protein H5P28_06375 [Ruficoccus amylovorans]|uniref:Adhesin domain-containing protein n=1 Tax=Ruficoccus amylovorans TaxID=1804625 RepID=A0A842HBP4_9BACT|nr:hypothetical protein [Ruficoccus amylovorans]MBC2593883.1 hypothetical protein [Ruficoccus amylovorans]
MMIDRPLSRLLVLGTLALTAHLCDAADGTWTSDSNGLWSDADKWQGGIVADGVGASATFDRSHYSLSRTIKLDQNRTLGQILAIKTGADDGPRHVIITGDANCVLTLDNGSSTATLTNSGSGAVRIDPAVALRSDLTLTNSTTTFLALNSAVSAASTGLKTLTISPSDGRINLAGIISDGAGQLALTVNAGSANVNVIAANTYSGGTSVHSGSLVTNTQSTLGTGDVTVTDGRLVLGNDKAIGSAASLSFGLRSAIVLNYAGSMNIVNAAIGATFIGKGTYSAKQLNEFFGGSFFSGSGRLTITTGSGG